MMIIGRDLHRRCRQIAVRDTETGIGGGLPVHHENGCPACRGFRRVGSMLPFAWDFDLLDSATEIRSPNVTSNLASHSHLSEN